MFSRSHSKAPSQPHLTRPYHLTELHCDSRLDLNELLRFSLGNTRRISTLSAFASLRFRCCMGVLVSLLVRTGDDPEDNEYEGDEVAEESTEIR